nr:lysosomal cystine transporter family protein [Aspergillus niger CBS 513.88]|eukprot:XP_001401680.2 lysosomal cystine transporter family protein [Aspergillus niger CBS 513.88]
MDAIQKTIVDPLQPLLRPVVSALPEPVHDAIISLIGSSCHNSLVVDLDVSKDPACTSLAISKALGIAIVGASGIVKVPQILKLIGSRSSAGVSFVSTFGETALIAVQDVVVGMLVLTFAGRSSAAAAFIAVVAASVYALLFDQTLVDAQTMAMLQAGAGALGVASKAPQIYTIWREGGTGQLSAFAVFNYLAGSLSRIFTTLQEVDDKLILYGFIAGFTLNLILAGQMLYYWNSPAKSQKKEKPVAAPTPAKTPIAATSSGVSPKPSGKTPTTRRRG